MAFRPICPKAVSSGGNEGDGDEEKDHPKEDHFYSFFEMETKEKQTKRRIIRRSPFLPIFEEETKEVETKRRSIRRRTTVTRFLIWRQREGASGGGSLYLFFSFFGIENIFSSGGNER